MKIVNDEWFTPGQIADALAGFIGSVSHAVRFPQGGGFQTFAVVFIGTVFAFYLTDDLRRYIPLSRGAIGFLVGFAAYRISTGILDWLNVYVRTRSLDDSGKPKDRDHGKSS